MTAVKVVFVSSHSGMGGSERYLERLLDRLGPEWIDRVVCLQSGPLTERLTSRGIPTEIIETGAGPLAIVSAGRRLKRSLSLRPADVIHANGVKAALVTALAGSRKTIWVKHDFSWDGRLARFIARRSRMVVGVSAAVLASIKDVAPTSVVYNGIDEVIVDRVAARERLRKVVGGEAEVVVLVGRLHPVKGHAELIEAAPELLRSRPEARLVFVGGPDPFTPETEPALRARVAELGIEDSIVFAGHRDDAVELMAAADVGTIPSVKLSSKQGREGFPLTALELMMVGTPVVAYASGGVPESLGECGVLVPEGDRRALAEGIGGLLGDAERRRALAECGGRRVRERFTMNSLVDAMTKKYLEVAGR